jgi:hypothetical protein
VDALPDGLIRGLVGFGEPEITPLQVLFNGDRNGHSWRDAIRPSDSSLTDAGVAFDLPQTVKDSYFRWSHADGRGWGQHACKTNGRPYDVAVTAALILLVHHFPRSCRVGSDGNLAAWQAGLDLA